MLVLKLLQQVFNVLPKQKGKNYSTEKYENLSGAAKKIAQTFEEESFIKSEYGINVPKKYYKKVLLLADMLDLKMETVAKKLRSYIWYKGGHAGFKYSKFEFWFLFTARYLYFLFTFVTLVACIFSVISIANLHDVFTAIQMGGYFVIYLIISLSIKAEYSVVKLAKDNVDVVV